MTSTSAPTQQAALLGSLFTADRVHQHLLPREAWRPFPRLRDREAWEGLPAGARTQTIELAEQHLGASWPELPATLFLEFRREGNRSRYEARHFARRSALGQLVLGECVEGQGRFLDEIVNGVWALCEESFWGVPAHSYSPRFPETGLPDTGYRVVDLFAAETGALLAWTHYLVGEQLAAELPALADRVVLDVEERLLVPYRTVDDWRWLGKVRRPVNNWNPWIHSNVLACNLLLEADPQVREATVQRAIEGLDVFLEGYHADGGCDEGTSYWGRAGASLFDCLELLHNASGGALDAFGLPLVQEIGRYIYRMHVGGDWYVNFADGSARVALEAGLVYRYGRRIGDPRMMAQGAYAYARRRAPDGAPRGASIARALPELLGQEELAAADPTPPLVRESWLDGIQVLTAREREGTTDGLFLAMKGGHNAESHNHNDVGQFVVAIDGHLVLIDVGVETYSRRTFGPQRYDIWTMQSQYHNLPVVNGHGQSAGRDFAARDVSATVDERYAELTLDISGTYPPEAGVERWQRTLRLERSPGTGNGSAGTGASGSRIALIEDFALARTPESLALHLMTSGAVDATEAGVLRCATPSRPLLIRYEPGRFTAAVEEIAVDDARLRPIWGDRVYRTVLTAAHPAAEDRWQLTLAAA